MTNVPDLKARYEQAVVELDEAMDRVAKLRSELLDLYCEVPEDYTLPKY